MSTVLNRLAEIPSGRRTKWVVLAAWVILAIVCFPLVGRLGEVEDSSPAANLPRGAESAAVLGELERFHTVDNLLPAVVVYTRDGAITADDRAKIDSDRTLFAKFVARGEQVSPPMPSDDGKAVLVVVPLPRDEGVDWPVNDMRAAAGATMPSGLRMDIGGPGGMLNDYGAAFENLDANVFVITGSIVIVLLLLIYRSPVLWLFPVLSVGFAVVLTQASTFLLAKHLDLPVNAASSSILMILVFGVGTDYALLLIARYREELRAKEDRHAAMAAAMRRAGPAIVASAGTVVIGLACLAFADLQYSRSLGLVGAVGVASAFLAIITVLPALLVIAGRWVFWPRAPRIGSVEGHFDGIWDRVGQFVSARPRIVTAASLVVIAALATGILGINMGLGETEKFQTKPEAVVAQEQLAEHFPSGASDPAVVVANTAQAEQVREAAARVPRTEVGPAQTSPEGDKVQIPVVLADNPESSAAQDTIDALRTAVHAVPGANALVGGATAETLDHDRAISHDLLLVIPLVLVVILLVLIGLLRALVAPLVLLATVVASYFAAVGAAALLFEHVLGHAGVDWSLPLVSFVFLAALGVDYNIFLITRVREEAIEHGHAEGVRRGLAATGGVITSAGIVLAATFVTFTTMPVVDMVQFGVVVGLGVLIDTFLVRTLLVPALALDLGRAMWWPGTLFRTLGARPDSPVAPTLQKVE